MKQKLRLFVLVVGLIMPFVAGAQLTSKFGATLRAGCATLHIPIFDSTNYTLGVGHGYKTTYVFYRDSASASIILDSSVVYTSNIVPYTPLVNLIVPGYYTVKQTVIDTVAGDTSVSIRTDYIYASKPLNVSFTTKHPSSDTGWRCPGKSLTFVNTSDSVATCGATYTWHINGPGTDTTVNTVNRSDTFSMTFNNYGSYDVSLVLNSCSYTCNAYATTLGFIKIDSLPVACFSTIDTTPCSVPVAVPFLSCSSGAGSYKWNFGDGLSSTSAAPIHTYTASGNYTDTLTAYSVYGMCPTTLVKNNYVRIGSRNFGFTMSASTGGPQTNVFCQGDSVIIKDTTSLASLHYAWRDNVGNTRIVNPTYMMYSTPGVYSIIDSAYNMSGCFGTAQKTLTVNATPIITSINTGPNSLHTSDSNIVYHCNAPFYVHFDASVIDAATPYTYRWSFGEQPSVHDTSSLASPVHIYTVMPFSGAFNDTCVITDANGCSSFGFFYNFITMGAPTLNVNFTFDSGCAPFPLIYTASINNIGLDSIPFTVDSVSFRNSSGYLFTDTTHGRYGIDTIRTGDYSTSATFYYHLPGYLGGCSYDTTFVVHVGGVLPPLNNFHLDTLVCPLVPVTMMADTNNLCPACTYTWNFGIAGSGYKTVRDTTVAYATPGYKKVILIGSLNGCNDTLSTHDSVHVLPPPMATITATQPRCSPTDSLHDFAFTGGSVAVSGAHMFYRWDWGDGLTSASDTFRIMRHNFPDFDNIWLVKLYDSVSTTGCTNYDSVIIYSYSFVDSMTTYDTLECLGKSYTFYGPTMQDSTHKKYAKYIWHWGDGVADTSVSTTMNNVFHTYTASGNYADTVIVKNMYGCFDTIYAANNTMSSNPSNFIHVGGPQRNATATPPAGCTPVTVAFHDAVVDSFGIATRRWTLSPPAVITLDSPARTTFRGLGTDTTLTFYVEGNYNVIVTDSDVLGCYVRDTIPVASQRVHAFFSSPEVYVSGCIGHQYTFTDTNSTCNYAWSFGDGATGTGQAPTHAYADTGMYTVKVIVTSAVGGAIVAGCVDSMTDSNYVNVQPMNTSFYLSDTFENCPPLFEIGTNTTIPPFGGYNFTWLLFPSGDTLGVSSYPQNLYTTIYTPGTRDTILLIAANPIGCLDSAQHYIQINGPAGIVSISKLTGCAPLAYDTLAFVDTNGTESSISNIIWFFGDGSSTTAGYSQVHTYMDTGVYHPYVTVDGAGCTNVNIGQTSTGHYTYSVNVFKLVDSVSPSTVICQGGSTTLSAFGAGTGGWYVWLPSTGLSATTGATVVANPTVTTTYRVVANTLGGCYDTMSVTVSVDSVLSVNIHAANASVCSGSSDSLVATGAQGTFVWNSAAMLSCTTCDTTMVVVTDTTLVKVTVADAYGCTATDSITINANPLPMLSSKGRDTVCSSVGLSYILTSNDTAATFVWSRSTVVGLSNGNASGVDTIAEALIDTTTMPVSATYSVTISAHGCITDTSILVTVNPIPVYFGTLFDSVCSGAPYLHLDSSTVGSTAIGWMRPMVSGILPDSAMGTGNIMDTLTNTGSTPVNVLYALTLNASGCISHDTLAVAVNPSPVLVGSRNASPACNDSLISYMPSASLSPATYSWSRAAVAGISNAAGTGTGNIGERLTNTTDTAITVTYTYTVSALGCSSDTDMVMAVVKPTAVLSSGLMDTICSGVEFVYVPASATPGLTYTWMRNTPSGISPAMGSGIDTIRETLENTTGTAVLTQYLVTLDNGGCMNVDTVSLLVVLPASTLHITTEAATDLCQGTMYQNFGASSPASGGTGLIWSATNATISTVGLTQQYCLVSFNNPGTAVIHVHSGISGIGCVAQLDSVTVNVGTGHADSGINVVYFEGNFYCLKNDVDGYQWGYDDVANLEGNVLTGETYQNYYNVAPDLANKYYWVMTYHNGCEQKTYFNAPALGVVSARTSALSGIKVYPNPSHDFLTVESGSISGAGVTVSVLNLLGQKLTTINAPTGKTRVDVSNLPNGSYFVVAYRDGVKFADALFIKD